MITLGLFLLGMGTAYALLVAGIVLLFKRGGWELSEREDQ